MEPVRRQGYVADSPRGPNSEASPIPSQVSVPKSTRPLPPGAADAGAEAVASTALHSIVAERAIHRLISPPCVVGTDMDGETGLAR